MSNTTAKIFLKYSKRSGSGSSLLSVCTLQENHLQH